MFGPLLRFISDSYYSIVNVSDNYNHEPIYKHRDSMSKDVIPIFKAIYRSNFRFNFIVFGSWPLNYYLADSTWKPRDIDILVVNNAINNSLDHKINTEIVNREILYFIALLEQELITASQKSSNIQSPLPKVPVTYDITPSYLPGPLFITIARIHTAKWTNGKDLNILFANSTNSALDIAKDNFDLPIFYMPFNPSEKTPMAEGIMYFPDRWGTFIKRKQILSGLHTNDRIKKYEKYGFTHINSRTSPGSFTKLELLL